VAKQIDSIFPKPFVSNAVHQDVDQAEKQRIYTVYLFATRGKKLGNCPHLKFLETRWKRQKRFNC